ncbi:MAG: hypothetical protein WAW91_00210 [Candidatus Nanoperiomorbaceae bacterium]
MLIRGDILNDYLSQAHNPDGTIKTGSITGDSLAAGVGVDGYVLTKDSQSNNGIAWKSAPVRLRPRPLLPQKV